MTNKEIKEMAQDEILAQLSIVKFLETQQEYRKLDRIGGDDARGIVSTHTELTEEEANVVAKEMEKQIKRVATQLFGYTKEYQVLN